MRKQAQISPTAAYLGDYGLVISAKDRKIIIKKKNFFFFNCSNLFLIFYLFKYLKNRI